MVQFGKLLIIDLGGTELIFFYSLSLILILFGQHGSQMIES